MATNLSVGVVREVPLRLLRPWAGNPRWINAARLDDLKRALLDDPGMLWARPLLVLPDGTVFSGNQRLRAAIELGWDSIPVLVVDLSPERARVWALRDNNQYGEWDEPLLAELLNDLAAEGLDPILAGFASSDLDRLLAGFELRTISTRRRRYRLVCPIPDPATSTGWERACFVVEMLVMASS